MARRGKLDRKPEKKTQTQTFGSLTSTSWAYHEGYKKNWSRIRAVSGSLKKRNTMKGLSLTFHIGMLGRKVSQPGKIGKKFYLLTLKKKKKKIGQEKQNLLNSA